MEELRRTLDLGWGRVSYLEWLPAQHPRATLVLLHGGGVDCAALSWGEVGPEWAEAGYRVVAPDHPGYGHSPLPDWTATQERLVDYVGEFVDALALGSYVLGGLSLGGGLCLGHLVTRPGRSSAALLFGTYGVMDRQVEGPLAPVAHLLTWAMLRAGLLRWLTARYAGNRSWMEQALRATVRDAARRTPALLDAVMAEASRPQAGLAFEQWQFDQFGLLRMRTNYSDQLENIEVPVLVVHGERDAGVPVSRARVAAGRIRSAELVVVPGAGHWVQRDQPEVVSTAVLRFLAGLT